MDASNIELLILNRGCVIETSGIFPKPYPCAKKVLPVIYQSDRQVAVIGAAPSEEIEKELSYTGLRKYISLALGNIKERTDGLLDVCRRLGKETCNALYVGYSAKDTEAANSIGMNSAEITGIVDLCDPEKNKADFLLFGVLDIMHLLGLKE